jgi:hypothetical protein
MSGEEVDQKPALITQEQSQPTASADDEYRPRIVDHIGSFFGASKEKEKLKCQVRGCNKMISYSASSYYNLKSHYQKQHPKKFPDFVSALSSGSKRGRHSSGAR